MNLRTKDDIIIQCDVNELLYEQYGYAGYYQIMNELEEQFQVKYGIDNLDARIEEECYTRCEDYMRQLQDIEFDAKQIQCMLACLSDSIAQKRVRKEACQSEIRDIQRFLGYIIKNAQNF
jgi:hypothetical protein